MATLSVRKWSGSIVYYTNSSGGLHKNIWPDNNDGGGGGIYGRGQIWSSVDQVVWVKYDGVPAYPIHVKPGYNDVEFWIPTILPGPTWVEAKLEIEAPSGYILIPAGFEWDILTGENAPPAPPNNKRIDKIRFKDLHDILINTPPAPPPPDSDIIDEYSFEDLHSIDLNRLGAIVVDKLDECSFEDLHSIDLNKIGRLVKDIIDNISSSPIDQNSYNDVYSVDISNKEET